MSKRTTLNAAGYAERRKVATKPTKPQEFDLGREFGIDLARSVRTINTRARYCDQWRDADRDSYLPKEASQVPGPGYYTIERKGVDTGDNKGVRFHAIKRMPSYDSITPGVGAYSPHAETSRAERERLFRLRNPRGKKENKVLDDEDERIKKLLSADLVMTRRTSSTNDGDSDDDDGDGDGDDDGDGGAGGGGGGDGLRHPLRKVTRDTIDHDILDASATMLMGGKTRRFMSTVPTQRPGPGFYNPDTKQVDIAPQGASSAFKSTTTKLCAIYANEVYKFHEDPPVEKGHLTDSDLIDRNSVLEKAVDPHPYASGCRHQFQSKQPRMQSDRFYRTLQASSPPVGSYFQYPAGDAMPVKTFDSIDYVSPLNPWRLPNGKIVASRSEGLAAQRPWLGAAAGEQEVKNSPSFMPEAHPKGRYSHDIPSANSNNPDLGPGAYLGNHTKALVGSSPTFQEMFEDSRFKYLHIDQQTTLNRMNPEQRHQWHHADLTARAVVSKRRQQQRTKPTSTFRSTAPRFPYGRKKRNINLRLKGGGGIERFSKEHNLSYEVFYYDEEREKKHMNTALKMAKPPGDVAIGHWGRRKKKQREAAAAAAAAKKRSGRRQRRSNGRK